MRGKGLQDLDAQLRRASGFAFYNTSRYDFDKLRADAPQLAANLRNYIAGFSPNMREVLEPFDFPTMGTIFEELIRRFNEALDENPGEHFTPRDVVHLMVDLMLAGDEARDGQLLFLLHTLAHAKDPKDGGSRIAIILEHDQLEALIALPEQLFYNTGIATYIWVVTNRKRVREAIARLRELRSALISAAVTGKIDVRAA